VPRQFLTHQTESNIPMKKQDTSILDHDDMMAELTAHFVQTYARAERSARKARRAAKLASKAAHRSHRDQTIRKFPGLDLMAAIMRDIQDVAARHERARLRFRPRSK
jgi:hypothetical protein